MTNPIHHRYRNTCYDRFTNTLTRGWNCIKASANIKLSILTGAVALAVYNRFYVLPDINGLKEENEALRKEVELMTATINALSAEIKALQDSATYLLPKALTSILS